MIEIPLSSTLFRSLKVIENGYLICKSYSLLKQYKIWYYHGQQLPPTGSR